MILREGERRPVVRMRLLVTGVVFACGNRLPAVLKHLFGLSQLVEQAGELAVPARPKPPAKACREFSNAGKMVGQRLPRMSRKWS
jgi:hypothetical protein